MISEEPPRTEVVWELGAKTFLEQAQAIDQLLGLNAHGEFPQHYYFASGPNLSDVLSGTLLGSMSLQAVSETAAHWQLILPSEGQIKQWGKHDPLKRGLDANRQYDIYSENLGHFSLSVALTGHNAQGEKQPTTIDEIEAKRIAITANIIMFMHQTKFLSGAITFSQFKEAAIAKLKHGSDRKDFDKRRYRGVKQTYTFYTRLDD